MTDLDYLNLFLALVLTFAHAVDLHTTGEVIKHNAGAEGNPLLAGFLNDWTRSWAERFWMLAAWKFVQALLGFALALIGYYLPTYAPWCAVALAGLCALYGWVLFMREGSNWRVYRSLKKKGG